MSRKLVGLLAPSAPLASVVLVVGLVACGGSSSSGSGSGSGTGSGTGAGSETPVVAGEDEGFEDDGFEDTEPQVVHGQQSAHELIGVHGPETPWANMSREEREWYMVGTVLPISAESFIHYDAERFEHFECANCHGDDAAALNYAMPSRALPPLAAPGTPQWDQMAARAAYTFMNGTVMPETATMLGMTPAAPDATTGFTCFSCHPHAGG